ncbi:glucosamine-6-phosphate deaminase [Geofilum rubicundum JCM 15548]|uniref:Glucosamine-6-phosphate deaminase n=1 Tax=Geofilum rubicundum JCM 15548 TaxID=1236989 RepID=A0A0E9LX09_9BACT|nr:glucosamine-6-phosphate deaminase [Geofilum rubicundum]GAO29848.1 glucosamine-6-phosphate deaminase [Geofilum rubicundum JCM 15548]
MDNSILKSHLEKVATGVFDNRDEGSVYVAQQIASLIKEKNKLNKPTLLGLATGSTPLLVYKELIRIHREEGLTFKNVITFNLDEYFPMAPEDSHSYHMFMWESFFAHIDIDSSNVHIPKGTLSLQEVEAYCLAYDSKIQSLGGLDIQVLGIGRSGHIGFNEPGSLPTDRTRLVNLNRITIDDASQDFGGAENVPTKAITMGVKTILQAKRIFLLAWGNGKADVVRQAAEGAMTADVPASFLQQHSDCLFVLDTMAASRLSRFETPWLIGECEWDSKMQKKAIIWLSKQSGKPILKLTESDYKTWGLNALLKKFGSAYDLNIETHNILQQTITGWPGGKPGSDDKTRPERSEPFPKRVLVFSPHPDDDVISMGGTLIRLAEQKHEVHVAYQTSGNIAVFDDDALRFTDFAKAFAHKFGVSVDQFDALHKDITSHLVANSGNGNAYDKVLSVKGLIRQGEATAACRYSGVKEENIHFLDLPFYETGNVKKKPLSSADVDIIVDLLRRVQPHQIFAAGDLQDPHGTHAVCLKAIFEALKVVKSDDWASDCWVWLYRGAWQEWDIEDIEMAVPISPDELMKKRKAIFKHQSQKDEPVFPGKDKREFWQRAEDRNRATARCMIS